MLQDVRPHRTRREHKIRQVAGLAFKSAPTETAIKSLYFKRLPTLGGLATGQASAVAGNFVGKVIGRREWPQPIRPTILRANALAPPCPDEAYILGGFFLWPKPLRRRQIERDL